MTTLIQPVLKGPALAAEIVSFRPGAGSLALWWLGQSGYVIKSRTGTLVIDAYLSEHLTQKYEKSDRPHVRMTESPLRGHELTGVDLFISTHKHSDHLDPGSMPDLMRGSPQAVLILPEAIEEHAADLGLPRERLWGMDDGKFRQRAGFTIRALPSAHEGLDTDDRGRHLYLGFIIEADGRTIYHCGDCMIYDGLAERICACGTLDAMFLPINGQDPARGVAGNMSASEAVALAAGCRPRYLVPNHYDMFTFNTVPIADFELAAAALPADVRAKILKCGERWEITS
jgi:L-ascorbate metabolism protein UlaG (beta-lactamase superfamily)